MSVTLPELDPSKVVYKLRDFDFESYDQDVFVRPVKLSLRHSRETDDIDTAIAVADKEFNKFASRCGAVVLPHTWGIVEINDERIYGLERDALKGGLTYYHSAFGKKRGLAASVETIRTNDQRTKASETLKRTIECHVKRYEEEMKGEQIPLDLRWDQFTHGTTATIAKPSLILHDIEPIIGYGLY